MSATLRTSFARLLENVGQQTRLVVSGAVNAFVGSDPIAPGSTAWYLRDKRARQALLLILDDMSRSHSKRLLLDFQSSRYSAMTRYVIHMAFLESVSAPVRPLALHKDLGAWLLALRRAENRYYPADPCWQCGYRYPGTSDVAQAASLRGSPRTQTAPPPQPLSGSPTIPASPPLRVPASHPWVGRRCLYCEGEIVNHIEWLDPNGKRTLADFQNAPYRTRQQSMRAQWRLDLEAVRLPPEWNP
jgi:hypothetical protein